MFVTPSQSKTGSGGGSAFPKSRRLLKRSDFRRVYEEGSRMQASCFAVFRLNRRDDGESRVGITAPRALGKAVIRNRIRRRMREAVRLELWRVVGPWDLVFHPRKALLETPMPALRREVEKILARCGTS